MRKIFIILVSFIAVVAIGLVGGAAAVEGYDGDAGTDQGDQMVGPSLTIAEPQEGANLTGDAITVTVNVTNFSLVDALGGENVPGEGHLHYYLDAAVPTNASAPAITAPGTYVPTVNTSHTWENVTPGEHNVSVQLVNNDHTPLIPLVYETVNVTVGDEAAPNVTPNLTGYPPEVAENAEQWPLPNRDYNNSRATTDVAINASNVDDLEVAWTFEIPGIGPYGAAASNPIILNDTVYFQDLQSNVYALNLEDGEVVWEQLFNETAVGPNGPGVGWGKVYAHGGVNQLRALNIENGSVLWTTELLGPSGAQQPTVYDGQVFTGTAAGAVLEMVEAGQVAIRGYAGGASGYVYGIDEETGNITWTFQTVEEGFWGNPEVNSGGGVWYTPAIDTESGLTFWGTGNPAPFPGTVEYPNGTSRPGPNLYTNAILAINHTTGELVWYNQVKPHDLFDLDFQVPRILAEADGQEIVIGSGKLGRVIAFERENGSIVWDTAVGEHQNDTLEEIPLDTVTWVLPGVYGGVETPMAMHNGTLYAPVLNAATPYTANAFNATNGTEAVGNAESMTNLSEATSEIVAIDVATGDILWNTTFEEPNFGGATVVNDLVFTATFDGTIYALNSTTGDIVWNYTAPAGINAWPAVANDTIVWPAGVGANASLIALRPGAEPPANVTEEPAVTIVEPEEGANLTGDAITVTVNVTNFSLVDALGGENVPGEGHLHYYLDAAVPTNASAPAITAPGTYVPTVNTSHTWENVTPGEHNVSVQLVNNDHTPLIPLVYETVNVTVGEEAAPTETPTEATPTPAEPSPAAPETVTVDLVAEGIAFDTDTITVPAGAEVTMNFENRDPGIPHNFAAYMTPAATDSIFVGEIITGPATTTYTFTAPEEPGTYFFRCDAHPAQMTGDFIVE
ncbi:MAG: PQQ-binding-like beta-propeller repeat protein [Methanomicrobiaceae archaeon]|nr:PQQ-binding-like beta-propeller repeat protein [Methanomicrobiaceae archaeon]